MTFCSLSRSKTKFQGIEYPTRGISSSSIIVSSVERGIPDVLLVSVVPSTKHSSDGPRPSLATDRVPEDRLIFRSPYLCYGDRWRRRDRQCVVTLLERFRVKKTFSGLPRGMMDVDFGSKSSRGLSKGGRKELDLVTKSSLPDPENGTEVPINRHIPLWKLKVLNHLRFLRVLSGVSFLNRSVFTVMVTLTLWDLI